MPREKKGIVKENWVSNFNLIGTAKINDHSFKINEKSGKSAWIYNSLNLGVDCGEKFGTVYCEMMGGYSDGKPNSIYVHGKKDDGTDNFEDQFTVDWDDRFDDDILETVGDLAFITVGLEKTDKDKTFYKRFISAYDAIQYIKDNIESGTIVNVKGAIHYSIYKDKVQVKKVINSIALSKADNDKFGAHFTQSILINSESVTPENIDKSKGTVYVDAKILDYVKEINGVEIRGQYPMSKQFEYEFPNPSDSVQCKKIVDKLFKVKKGYTQIAFEGDLIEGGAVVTTTLDDIPQDIKDLIECGIYSESEALVKCSSNGNRAQRMVLRKPLTRLVGEEKIAVLQIFPERYAEDDLTIDCSDDEETGANTTIDEDLDWLKNL